MRTIFYSLIFVTLIGVFNTEVLGGQRNGPKRANSPKAVTGSKKQPIHRPKFMYGGDGSDLVLFLHKGRLRLPIDMDPYSPICHYILKSDLFLVSRNGELECYSGYGKLIWKARMDYANNPDRLVVTSYTVSYTMGPMSLGAGPQTESEARAWKQSAEEVWRVITRNLKTGHVLWNKSWITTGTPCFPYNRSTLITIRTVIGNSLREIRRINQGQTLSFLELRGINNSHRIRGWRLPRWIIRKEYDFPLHLSNLLGNPYTLWKRDPRNKRKFTAYEPPDSLSLQDVPLKSRFICKLSFGKTGVLRIHCLNPINKTAIIRLERR